MEIGINQNKKQIGHGTKNDLEEKQKQNKKDRTLNKTKQKLIELGTKQKQQTEQDLEQNETEQDL